MNIPKIKNMIIRIQVTSWDISQLRAKGCRGLDQDNDSRLEDDISITGSAERSGTTGCSTSHEGASGRRHLLGTHGGVIQTLMSGRVSALHIPSTLLRVCTGL